MEQLTRNKVLIGSLYKGLNNARITGLMDLKMLYFLNIVNSYILSCENVPKFKEIQKLKQIVLIIQNREKNICTYRFNDLIKFASIVGCENCKPGLNNNPFQVTNNNPTISNPDPIEPSPECPTLCSTINIDYPRELFFVSLFNTSELFNELTTICYSSIVNSPAKFLKIMTVPMYGTLLFVNEISGIETILTAGSVLDLNDFNVGSLQYIYNQTNEDFQKNKDLFKIALGDSQSPSLTTNSSTIFLNPI
jgi:hypothetical protein